MKLRGVEFGNVFNASGARGFDGEGYWFHRLWKPFGLDYSGSTFVAKTTTLMARKGNMELTPDCRPVRLLPDCIVVKPLKGVVLNSVGLSGPGLGSLMYTWRSRDESPFFISFMPTDPDGEGEVADVKYFVKFARSFIESRRGRVGIQLNVSCPNAGSLRAVHHLYDMLDLLGPMGAPVLVKVNALAHPSDLLRITENHPACDGVVVSNTIPWGEKEHWIDWEGLFGSGTSPLAKYGGGGLSGKPLLPLVKDWVIRARTFGALKKIVAGGGVLSQRDAGVLIDAGANAVELGSVSILRPWRVGGIVRYVNIRLRGIP